MKKITVRTAQNYLQSLGYWWSQPKKGQYADGHKCSDVVAYRENAFVPRWKVFEIQMQNWTKDGEPEIGPLVGKQVISWHHDEVIFYMHDRRGKGWHHKNAPAKPY
jgi:hypothetical protein